METTNDLRYTETKKVQDADYKYIRVKIRLNDECRNGHEVFSITGDCSTSSTGSFLDRSVCCSGCIHEEIEKHFPELKPFIDLHLAQFDGVPMYAVANGLYHLENGFSYKKTKFWEEYNIPKAKYDILKNSAHQDEYKYYLNDLKILEHWNKKAAKAIDQLEQLTGKKFKSTATKNRNEKLTPEEMEVIKAKVISGYYALERDKNAEIKLLNEKIKLQKEMISSSLSRQKEHEIKMYMLENAPKNTDNFIYYPHSNTLAFNWRGYSEKVTDREIKAFKKKIKSVDVFRGVEILSKDKM